MFSNPVFIAALSGSTWTPAALFAAGEVGAWFDPSDLTTLFQDSAGTTPVTAVEQPVGKILDKSGRGNHATQATAASRPVLSARVNLLQRSNEFSTSPWLIVAGGLTLTQNVSPPFGSNNAWTITEAANTTFHGTFQSSTLTVESYTFSCYMKAGERTWGRVSYDGGGAKTAWFNLSNGTVGTVNAGLTAAISSAGSGWYLCSISFTGVAVAGSVAAGPAISDNGSEGYLGDGTSRIYIFGADLRPTNQTSGLPAYQRVVTGTTNDYDTAGFPLYLKFDGVDDSLATGTITPTTDKAQVFAGVRKLSDAAVGIVAELSADRNVNTGALTLTAPSAAAANYGFGSKGTNDSFQSVTAYTAPITNIVTGIGDVANDTNIIRVNGAQVASSAVDQGTGNYGAYPLYIGRRGGATLPLNGNLYGLLVRFSAANLDASTISRAETWLNSKTGAY